MLIPRRVKFRKQHHPKRHGLAKGGTEVSFGEWGIQALSPAYVTNRQIEAARIAMTRHIKRGGKVWIYKGDLTDKELAAQQAANNRRGNRRDGDRRRQGNRGPRRERRNENASAKVEAKTAENGEA